MQRGAPHRSSRRTAASSPHCPVQPQGPSARWAWRQATSRAEDRQLDYTPRMTPKDVAQALREISQLLQIKGENAFKVRAYDMGADAFDTLPADPAAPGGLNERVKNGTLTGLGGVGKAISEKVTELVSTGRLRY